MSARCFVAVNTAVILNFMQTYDYAALQNCVLELPTHLNISNTGKKRWKLCWKCISNGYKKRLNMR